MNDDEEAMTVLRQNTLQELGLEWRDGNFVEVEPMPDVTVETKEQPCTTQ